LCRLQGLVKKVIRKKSHERPLEGPTAGGKMKLCVGLAGRGRDHGGNGKEKKA